MLHQISISISGKVICEGYKVDITISGTYIHRTTYISMYKPENIVGSFTFSIKG